MSDATSHKKEISLRDIPIFSGLAETDLQKIEKITFEKIFKTGEFLFRAGDAGDAFYIIKSGNIQILKKPPEEDKVIVTLGHGEFFGEMALIEGSPRSASARAANDATMLVVKKSDFELLLRLNSFVALKIMSELSKRLHGDIATPKEKEEHLGALVTLFSPKGGCGKTMTAINLAEAFLRQKPGCKVLLLDLDLQFGDIGSVLKMRQDVCIKDILREDGEAVEPSKIDSVIMHHAKGFDVINAPIKPEDSELISSKHIKQLLPKLKERYDFILVDTHCLFMDLTINLLNMADVMLILFLPVLIHLKNLTPCLRVMNNLEFDLDKICLVVNRYNLQEHGSERVFSPSEIESHVQSTTKLKLKVKLRLSDQPELMAQCIERGETIFGLNSGEPTLLGKELDLLANCLLDSNKENNFIEPPKTKTGFWG